MNDNIGIKTNNKCMKKKVLSNQNCNNKMKCFFVPKKMHLTTFTVVELYNVRHFKINLKMVVHIMMIMVDRFTPKN